MLALDDLITSVTADQAEKTILDLCAKLGLPVTAWQKGGVARTIIRVLATVYAAFTVIIALAIGGGFLDYAVAGWLTLLARNVYGVTRIPATFARTAQGITLTNAGGGLYVIAPDDLRFSRTVGPVTYLYRNTSGGTLYPGPGTILTLDLEAVEVGKASNAPAATITTLETALLGVTCTNPLAVLGQDEETDPALRERCRDSMGALSPNGPKAAYRYVARSAKRADGVTSCGVTRVKIPTPPGDGSLIVYIAGEAGAVAGTIGDLATDLGIVDDDIQNKVVPEGVGPVTVASATPHTIDVAVDVAVDVRANLSAAAVQALVRAALLEWFPTLPIGGVAGKVRLSTLLGIIEGASPYILWATISTPASDVIIAGNEVPVLGAATTPTVSQVMP